MSENCKKHIKPVSGLNCPAAVLVVNIEKIERKGKYYLSFFSPFIGVFGFFMRFFDIFYLYFNVLAFFVDLLHLRHKIQQFLWLFCNSADFCGCERTAFFGVNVSCALWASCATACKNCRSGKVWRATT